MKRSFAFFLFMIAISTSGFACSDAESTEREPPKSSPDAPPPTTEPAPPAPPLDPAILEISSGKIRGEEVGGVWAFRGIPYAEPPTGQLRFRAPETVHAWQGVRDARSFGDVCIQP